MYYIIFSVIILIINKCINVQLSTTEYPPILNSLSSSKHEGTVYFPAVANEPFHLRLQYMNTLFRGWCDAYQYQNKVKLETLFIYNSTINVKNATNNMSTLWKCTVFVQPKKGEQLDVKVMSNFDLDLNLHVKGAKSVEFFVNGSAMSFSPVALSVPYDGETIFYYEDGGHINVVCVYSYGKGSIILEYTKKDEMKVFYTGTFGMQLNTESNNSYIDCVYGTTQPVDKYVYRVILVIKNELDKNKTQSDAPTTPDETPLDARTIPDKTPLDARTIPDETQLDAPTIPDKTLLDARTIPDKTPLDARTIPDETPLDAPIIPDKTPLDAQSSANLVQDSGSTSLIVGSSIGAVLLILGVVGVAYWYRRTRKLQPVETPYGDVPKEDGCPTQTNDCQNNYDSCHYSEHLPERGPYYDQAEGLDNTDSVDHYYTKIDYSKCKQKGREEEGTKSEVYDEPYV